jgi:hypothetical protein
MLLFAYVKNVGVSQKSWKHCLLHLQSDVNSIQV